MGEAEVQGKKIAANLSGNILFNPIVIWLAHCFFSHTIGYVLVAGSLNQILVGGSGVLDYVFSTEDACGAMSTRYEFGIIACRLFFPFATVMIFYVPSFVCGFIVWLVISLKSRQLRSIFNRGQRWLQICMMSLFPTLYVVIAFKQFSENFFFSPYGPYLPVILMTCSLVTPLLIWFCIDYLTKTRKGTSDV